MEERIMAVIRENADGEIDRSTILGDVCDSLDVVNMTWDLEQELDVDLDEEEMSKFLNGKTVGECVDHLISLTKK